MASGTRSRTMRFYKAHDESGSATLGESAVCAKTDRAESRHPIINKLAELQDEMARRDRDKIVWRLIQYRLVR
ncbi:hypothetical protein CH63R_10381 [Colletotrichum higginsianum IMI 349063]|uniref:Uncharacterized protein n=1 Tax=Colletotrichum higginsianum (strain IMI 349063) TaxID=759273 RepID=A0A1B7Y2M2_COLHI|nr:uncharacterized protein CH63R_10381 [Colletotrichum higginsianum IMI 349063]OBR06261.1 hypothetical protein CH63R_10381 [Colletotrichum higginsianum IMI 349063]GJD01494.1 hypothetical protein ColKHC_10319 [Colletotrichum higginsianum]